ncbi:MAG: glycosyltransferase family 2 protein [Methanobacterium sp.]|nr:glycosyltransferase family 2 protein [Methanobacterium sp.]
MSSEKKICAVIVTFNRKKLLLECLESLKNQTRPLEAIFIIDNHSTDGTPNLLFEKKYINEKIFENNTENCEKNNNIYLNSKKKINIHYLRLKLNYGGAGGFYEGLKRAYETGYDWIWLMDDDAEPQKNALKCLTNYFHEKNISALASVVKTRNNEIQLLHRGLFEFKDVLPSISIPLPENYYNKEMTEIDFASFVGILINNDVIKKVGFPKKEFFIYYDDLEYCIRLRTHGRILLIKDSIIKHKEASENIKKLRTNKRLKKYDLPFENFWLRYYSLRNMTWLGKKYNTNILNFYSKLLLNIFHYNLLILLHYDNKFKRIKSSIYAYYDGIIENFDNDKPKRILY